MGDIIIKFSSLVLAFCLAAGMDVQAHAKKDATDRTKEVIKQIQMTTYTAWAEMTPDNQLCGDVTTQTDGFDFRNVKWGMTKEQVIKAVGISPASEKYSDILKRYLVLYFGEIGGLEAIIGYQFKNNALVEGVYEIIEEHKYDNDYVDDYKKLKLLLSNKYGEPEFDITKWANDKVQNNYKFWQRGLAVKEGNLVFQSEWKTPRTSITLILLGRNNQIVLLLTYESKGNT